jgi:hypothetical protein
MINTAPNADQNEYHDVLPKKYAARKAITAIIHQGRK